MAAVRQPHPVKSSSACARCGPRCRAEGPAAAGYLVTASPNQLPESVLNRTPSRITNAWRPPTDAVGPFPAMASVVQCLPSEDSQCSAGPTASVGGLQAFVMRDGVLFS